MNMINKTKVICPSKVPTLELLRELYHQPTANIFKVAEVLVKCSVDTSFGDNKQQFPSVQLILDNGTVITPIFVNENHVFFSMFNDVDSLKTDDEYSYTFYNKKGVNYIFSDDEKIIRYCKMFKLS